MLVYVATYPRAGSSFIKYALETHWGIVLPDGYADTQLGEDMNARDTGHPDIVAYRSSEGATQRMVRPPSLKRLTPGLRAMLASDSETFFIKTHDMPPLEPIQGERAIQLIRHPVSNVVARWRKAIMDGKEQCPVAISNGRRFAGCWSAFNRSWLNADMPRLTLYRECLDAPGDRLITRLAEFADLPHREPDFYSIITRRAEPGRNLADDWRTALPAKWFDMIWRQHEELAACLGYDRDGATSPDLRPGPARLALP